MATKLGGGGVKGGWGHSLKRSVLHQRSVGNVSEKGNGSRSLCANSSKQQHSQESNRIGEVSNVTVSGLNGYHGVEQMPLRRKLRVAVDVDEVLGRFLICLNMYCKEEYGMDYNVEDYWIYEFAKIWGCSGDTSNKIVHDFFKSAHFREGIPVIAGARETLRELTEWCDLMVVTSRQHLIRDVTMEWINCHFPGIFGSVHFGNHFARQGTSKKKSTICRDIGADVLIDDNPSYALDCASNGVDVILFNWHDGYPWSTLPPGQSHSKIHKVSNWLEVKDALLKIRACRECLESHRVLE